MDLSHVYESVHLSDNTVMIKVPIDSLNIILTYTPILATASERSNLNIFVSEDTWSPDLDPRMLKKAMIFTDDHASVLNIVHKLRTRLCVDL